MKKIIVLCLLITGFTQLKSGTTPIYHKSKGGLFGYRNVTTTSWPDLNIIVVTCTDPGVTRCKAAAAITMSDGSELTPETIERIDKTVTGLLTPTHTSGNLIYGEHYFVSYTYDIELDDLWFKIYTISEAIELGLM